MLQSIRIAVVVGLLLSQLPSSFVHASNPGNNGPFSAFKRFLTGEPKEPRKSIPSAFDKAWSGSSSQLPQFPTSRRDVPEETAIEKILTTALSYALSYMTYRLISKHATSFLDKVSNQLKTMSIGEGAGDGIAGNITKYLQANVTLNSYEKEIISTAFIDPDTISEAMADIGGLDSIKSQLVEISVLDQWAEQAAGNSKDSSKGSSNLGLGLGTSSPVVSVLLFGPPGVGKSMLARALASELELPLLRIMPSSLLRKYLGETSQLTAAVFSAAAKLAPCVLFIDEVDFLFQTGIAMLIILFC
jgi:hypothetical protein